MIGNPVFPAAWCEVLNLETPILRFSCTRAIVRLTPIGETLPPNERLLPPPAYTPEPLRSTNTTRDTDSVITAEARMSARAEKVRRRAQRFIRDAEEDNIPH